MFPVSSSLPIMQALLNICGLLQPDWANWGEPVRKER
jgi:hypothetical protein